MVGSFNQNYNKAWLNGFVFVFLFVLQQILAFTYLPFSLVEPYWILLIIVFFLTGMTLSYSELKNSDAFNFVLLNAGFSVLTLMSGSSIGYVICKILFLFFGFMGYVFIMKRTINVAVFDLLLISLYIFFYRVYFQYDIVTRLILDGDLFGHASSNTIPMTLNIVLFYYILISWVNKSKNKIRLIIYSIINLFLTVVQGSRAGMLVALTILIVLLLNNGNKRSKSFIALWLITIIVISLYLVQHYMPAIVDFLASNEISSDAYENDVRSEAVAAFFNQMDFTHFLFGYSIDYHFVGHIDRTFNAFFDFWKVYGFIPFVYMVFLLIKRIIHHREYDIPLFLLIPFFVYSLFESLWGGSLWDVLLFMVLFYSRKDEKVIKANNSLACQSA